VGFLGDPASPPALDLLVLRADDTVAPLADGDHVPMLFPPQGGRVIFVGVRVTNVDACGLQLTGALRDEATRQVSLDSRTVDLVPTGDGYGASAAGSEPVTAAIASFANVPTCPNQWASTDIFGHEFGLEVSIKDRGGRTMTKAIHVTPECGEPENLGECLCICAAGYVLGQMCPGASDAGVE
jgi:hypothetical protein